MFAAPVNSLCYNEYIMKIAICSDLHLEFGDIDLKNEEGADVLVLAGDILVAVDLKDHDPHGIMEGTRSNRFQNFFQRVCDEFPHVVYIAGNHESYSGDIAKTYTLLKYKLLHLDNLHILDRECFKLGDVTFIGGTLWTDMNKEDSLTLYHVKSMMNDFQIIKNSNRYTYRKVPIYKEDETGERKYELDGNGNYITIGMKMKEEVARFSPEDSVEEHKKMIDYIRVCTTDKDNEKFVVVGHHAPSALSIHEMYKHDTVMNGAYFSDLSELMLDRPCIKLWVHGHVHNPFDYQIGECRVVCNPRGYIGHEYRAREFKLKYVEI